MEFSLQCCREWGEIKEGFADLFMNLEGTKGTPALPCGGGGVFVFLLGASCNSQGSAIPSPLIQTPANSLHGWLGVPLPSPYSQWEFLCPWANSGPQLGREYCPTYQPAYKTHPDWIRCVLFHIWKKMCREGKDRGGSRNFLWLFLLFWCNVAALGSSLCEDSMACDSWSRWLPMKGPWSSLALTLAGFILPFLL